MKHSVAILLLSSLLLFLFGYTGISKLKDNGNFAAFLSQIPFLSMGAAVLALAIPVAELVIVLLLFFSTTRLHGLYASAGLLFLFTLYLVGMLLFAPHLPCRCGGAISGMGWWEHVAMNVGLVLLTLLGIRKGRRGREEAEATKQ